MDRCILAPIDGTAFGEHALPLAASVARRAEVVLHLAHVHVPVIAPAGLEMIGSSGPWNERLRDQESGYLEGLAERLERTFGVRVRHQVLDGSVPDALERYAGEVGAGLLVMSSHGHAGIRRVWHHCVAERIIDELPVPVLLMRPADEEEDPDLAAAPEPRHLLIALDGSGDASAALESAMAIGRGFRARYTLLRVVPPAARDADGELGRHSAERERLAARDWLEQHAARMRAAGLELTAEVLEGARPAEVIVERVRSSARGEAPVELVVMERHPHRGLAQSFATHTTDAVVRDAGVPVLIVHGAPAGAAGAVEQPVALRR